MLTILRIISDPQGLCNWAGSGDIKILTVEKALLGLTAAFLLIVAGYFWGVRSTADPYRVDVQYTAVEETAPPSAALPSGPTEKININTATAAELEVLPGIGEKRAEEIVADREANGPFRIPEDITRVSGIGEGTLAGLIEDITVE